MKHFACGAVSCPPRCSVSAVIVRANGYREDLGEIAFWDPSLLKRLQWRWRKARSGAFFLAADPVGGLITTLGPLFLAAFQVTGGRAVVTGRLLGTTQPSPQYMSWGTGPGTTGQGDTTLFAETYSTFNNGTGNQRIIGVMTQQNISTPNDTEQVVATIAAAQAQNGVAGQLNGAIAEVGLFDNIGTSTALSAAPSGGNMYFKADFAAEVLALNDSITFTCQVQYT